MVSLLLASATVMVVVGVVVPAVALAMMVVFMATVTFIIVVDVVDEQVVIIFGDQLDGRVNLDEAEKLRILEQCSAIAGQNVLHCRTWHREGTSRFVNDADLAPIDASAPTHTLQLHLAVHLINGLHKNDAKLAPLYSFQGYVHSVFWEEPRAAKDGGRPRAPASAVRRASAR